MITRILGFESERRKDMKSAAKDFGCYLIVGGIAFAADFTTLILLTEKAGLHYLWSATIAFLVGTTINYLLSTRWVFSVRSVKSRVDEYILFAALGMIGIALNSGIIALLVELAGVAYPIAKLVATGLVLFFNFGSRKWLLFSHFSFKFVNHELTGNLPQPHATEAKTR